MDQGEKLERQAEVGRDSRFFSDAAAAAAATSTLTAHDSRGHLSERIKLVYKLSEKFKT